MQHSHPRTGPAARLQPPRFFADGSRLGAGERLAGLRALARAVASARREKWWSLRLAAERATRKPLRRRAGKHSAPDARTDSAVELSSPRWSIAASWGTMLPPPAWPPASTKPSIILPRSSGTSNGLRILPQRPEAPGVGCLGGGSQQRFQPHRRKQPPLLRRRIWAPRVILPKHLLTAAIVRRHSDYEHLLRDNYETPFYAPRTWRQRI